LNSLQPEHFQGEPSDENDIISSLSLLECNMQDLPHDEHFMVPWPFLTPLRFTMKFLACILLER
jgi:hypothetical protein